MLNTNDTHRGITLTTQFVEFICALKHISDKTIYNEAGVSPGTLKNWKDYVDPHHKNHKKKPDLRTVVQVLQKALDIGPNDDSLLVHWFGADESQRLKESLQGKPGPDDKWWHRHVDKAEIKRYLPPSYSPRTVHPLVDVPTLKRSGLVNAFRIKDQDPARMARVKSLVETERQKEVPHFRLLASSGFSYLNPHGIVWNAGLGEALHDTTKKAKLDVVLQSPFSIFSLARALANKTSSTHWEHKVNYVQLERLNELPNVSIKVTDYPINCSLFFTSEYVLYDPYLWGSPLRGVVPTENNFWVFEFTAVDDRKYDCYRILESHFEFLLNSGSIELRTALEKYSDIEVEFEKFIQLGEQDESSHARLNEILSNAIPNILKGTMA
jgi:hypothetical protein